MAASGRLKVELPLASEADLASLATHFEACTLPYENWTHRAHIALAVHYLKRFTPEEALIRLRKQIQLFNKNVGDPAGYHETITRLFVRKISAYLAEHRSPELPNSIDELAQTCGLAWMLSYYSPERLWSAEARNEWLEPDIQELNL